MPFFRGIEISIITSSDVRKLPEYPHPDGSSVRLMRVGTGLNDLRNGGRASPHSLTVSRFSDADPTRQKKVNPRISVYIPSSPGDQFRLRYFINQSPLPSRFIFFKMLINGHHTVSWGIDASSCSLGSVTRSLYEPGERFRDKNGDPVVGIETRYLRFVGQPERKPGDEDGGLIEVQVFRCRGRKRIAVVLDPCPSRNRERRGITLSSGGLVDDPQDASFYEYHLEDARDSPYATFCFHYRPTKCLEQLNIIPSQETKNRPVSMNQNSVSVPNYQENISRVNSSLDGRVLDDSIEPVGVALSSPDKVGEYSSKRSTQILPIPLASLAIEGYGQSREEIMGKMGQRPLPEPPHILSGQVSRESIRSSCPSLTPSLKQYAESEEFEKEEVQLSMAQPVFIPSGSMQALELGDLNIHDQGDNSFSDYAVSPSSTETSHSPKLPPPEGYLPTTGSVLERQLNQFDSPVSHSQPTANIRWPIPQPEGAVGLVGDVHSHEVSTLTMTEAEWLRQSPSPQRRRGNAIERLWSPRPGKRSGRSSMVELPTCRCEATNLERPDDEIGARSAQVEGNDDYTDEVPAGNWI
ncbi:uncharacterized protein GGS22DRAFT_173545 [Annulohypoxylon maeteangense]|uniref:uncharacterized protein n=1 Tax=Annulohypoxylon maeteangense TaxID=1927788 RepID=UPI002008A086|nr:uncharacterized protein GGS22DRAFT_173545 [Annulohypoxylon maeteangense]KAI0881176.1 hypothetical protein GGS22DRAFT_173545 [Annulohypoxylon maeteangense]